MNPTRKSKALGWGAAAVLLLACAGYLLSRPTPAAISLTQLEARSALDARALAGAVPAKVPDKRLSLLSSGDLPSVIAQIAGEVGVSGVRLWSPSGTLLASSDPNDATAATASDAAVIAGAVGAGAKATDVAGQAGQRRIFEPVWPAKSNAVVAEIVRSTTEGGLPFKTIGAGLGAFGVLALIIALASLRGGSGTKAAPVAADGSLPAPDDEPADAEDGAPARSSVRLTQKLQTSEASRAAMETQMEQLRAQLRMGTQGSEQMMADLDRSLASSQQRVHEANEKAVLAETRARTAEQRAVTAEEALSRATPSDAADRAVVLEAELAAAKGKIAELEGSVAEHQARTRDAEARAGETEKRVKVVAAQVAEHAALSGQAESRQRELEDRAATAEARATQAEAAARGASAPVGGPDVTALEVRASAAEESAAQLQIELSRAQDLAEQALAKLDTSEDRVTSAEAKAAEAQRRADVAERRAMVARGAPENLSLEESQAAITAPVIEPAPPAPETAVSESEPAVPGDEKPSADASATDPGVWQALAKTLRRNALGDEAVDDEPEEEPAAPTKAVSDNDRSELRARLAKASAKKRRKPE